MSLSDRLHRATSTKAIALPVKETISDIARIMALPMREPVDCERDPRTKQYKPTAQILIEKVTAKFTRGKRISCACRERRVRMLDNGMLLIARVLSEDELPEAPIIVSSVAFIAELQDNRDDVKIRTAVRSLQPGQEVVLPSVDVRGHNCITMLNAVQSWFLHEAATVEGVVGFCGVGSGKSIAFLLAATLFADSKLGVLLIEPKQRAHYRSQYVRLREHFKVGSIVFDDNVPGYTVAGTPPLHLISYSVLSQTKNSELLDSKNPDVVMLDEGHRACGDSAINRRVKRYCAKKIRQREEKLIQGELVSRRALRLLVGSGTLENKSVEDTQMVCAYSLGTGSPLPVDPAESERWSNVMDQNYMPDRTSKTAKILQRTFAGREYNDDISNIMSKGPESAIREGFRRRRLATPGIISASASTINAAIYLSERKPPKMPPSVKDALSRVREESLRPDGEMLAGRMEVVSCARNVACGFYKYWAFPKHKCDCTAQTRCKDCSHIDLWYAHRKAFAKELRLKLLLGEPNLDSRSLCEEAAIRFYQQPKYTGELPTWAALSWPEWAAIEDTVEYDEREKWIVDGGDWLAKDAAEWATKHKGVVWFLSIAFGRKVQELTGLPYFNGGPGAEERMRAEKGDRSIIVSINAHGAGTDGLQQIYNHQLIAESPASNSTKIGYEQLLGRLHREGQRKDEVITEGYFHVRELKEALRKAIEQAEFNFEMQKNKQKLLMADITVDGL
jgi:hypothetical protein